MQDRKTTILYIDDEENNLTSFKASFRRDFDVFVTTQANEAVQILNENPVHLIIADQKMPDISGVEFLELVKSEFPDPIRILLTGYADIEAVIDAINRGQVYRYITKPWDEQELRMVFANAREHFDTKTELKSKNKQLTTAFKDLERFVYSASHDLRAPLASIRGIVDLAKAENDPTNAGKYLDMVETNILQLDYYTQNLINYYHNLNEEVVNSRITIAEWFNEVLAKARTFSKGNSAEVVITNSPEQISTDPTRLGIAINNLLVNALTHGSSSSQELRVQLEVKEDEKELLISVQDNGSGISPKKLAEIKEIFEQKRSYHPGFGMGLFIVNEVTRKLGGRTSITSEASNGTKVSLILPKA